jgi:hypothetical protein
VASGVNAGLTGAQTKELADDIKTAVGSGTGGGMDDEEYRKRQDEYDRLRAREKEITDEMEKQSQIDTLQASLDSTDKLIAKLEDARDKALERAEGPVFGEAFDKWRDDRKAAAAEEKRQGDDMGRYWRLVEKEGKQGRKLSKEDQKYLADVRDRMKEQADAAKEAQIAEGQLKAAQQERDRIQGAIKDLNKKQYDELVLIRQKADKLWQAPAGG